MSQVIASETNNLIIGAARPEGCLPAPNKGKRGVFLILLALSVVIFAERLYTYNEPLERDITTYSVVAHQMLEGKLLYAESWDHKPPAIHVTYAVAQMIAGYGRNSILLLSLTASVATLVACYFAGSAISNSRFGGLLAAAIWTVVNGDLGLEANQPNTEIFLNALLLSAFAVMIMSPPCRRGIGRALIIGTLFALASVYKQVAIIPAALLCVAHIATSEKPLRKRAIIEVAVIAGVGAVAWMMVFGYFLLGARIESFVDAVFVYNRAYAGDLGANLTKSLAIPKLAFEPQMIIGSLAMITLIGAVAGFIRNSHRAWLFLGAFGLATHVAILLPGQFFPHYYQLWLPPLIIGTAWSITLLAQSRIPGRAFTARVVAGVVLAGLTLLELPSYFLPPDVWSFQKYGPVFVQSEQVARHLSSLMEGNETFFEWGGEPGLYFLTKRDPVTAVFFADPLLRGPQRGTLWRRVAAELRKAKPDVVVLEKNTVFRTPAGHPVLAWVKRNYRALSQEGLFLIMARKGSRIDRNQPTTPITPLADASPGTSLAAGAP